jgi:hypothetical protein
MPEMVDVVLAYNDSSFKIYIDIDDPAALFFTQVYLATSVWPPRQKITGFLASDGQVTISPLLPDANFKQLNIKKGMTLSLTQYVPPPFATAARLCTRLCGRAAVARRHAHSCLPPGCDS